jgi:putative DNA primase/helicase
MPFDTIQERQHELETFINNLVKEPVPKNTNQKPLNGENSSGNLDPQTVLNRALKSQKGPKIKAFLDGKNCGLPSDSEGDLSLFNYLVFFCGQISDEEVYQIVDSIYRKSKRYRPKWDEVHRPADGATYGRMTLEKAIKDTTKRFNPKVKSFRTLDVPKILARIGKSLDDIIDYAYAGQQGCRDLFIDVFRDKYCFDHAEGLWYEFQGHSWEEEITNKAIDECTIVKVIFVWADSELDKQIINLGQQIQASGDQATNVAMQTKIDQAKKQQKVLRKVIKSLNTLTFRKHVVEFATAGRNSLGIRGDEWDSMPWHLACNNGVLDLKTGELRDGMPADYLKSASPTNYVPNAQCPRFENFLHDIFGGSPEMISFIRRVLGSSLVGKNVEHKLFVFSGPGRNGKDTLLGSMKFTMGGALAGAIRSEVLLDQGRMRSSSGPTAEIMRLRGLRLVWASEVNEDHRMDSGQVKLLTGGGDLVGRGTYGKHEVSFSQSYSLFLLTNSKPHAPADDYALWQRIILIEFNTRFVDHPKNPNEKLRDIHLKEKLKEEAEGILAWLVRGCLEWQRIGLQPPQKVTQATEEYRRDEDILQQFIDEACDVHNECICKASALYRHFKRWSENNGFKPMTSTAFGRKMSERFKKEKKNFGKRYVGIEPISTNDIFTDE